MTSRPEIVYDGYLENHAPQLTENAYTFASEGGEDRIDWDKATWYVAPNDDELEDEEEV